MTKKIERPTQTKAVGYGYVGMWSDGTLGWFMPRHFGAGKRYKQPACAHPEWPNIGEPSFLCKITLELVPNAKPRRVKP
jgi:hypothetical protein